MADPQANPIPQPSTQTDASSFIRTYAKDVATLQGSQPAAAAKFAPSRVINERVMDGVALPEYDASPRDHAGDPASPKEFKTETIDLPSMQEAGDIVGGKPRPQPMSSMMPAAPVYAPAPLEIPPHAPAEDRDAILARLRAKVASGTVPTTPTGPSMLSSSAPVMPSPVVVSVPPAAPPLPPTSVRKEAFADSAPLHTYSTDFADQIDSKKASKFSVLAAQEDAKKTAPAPVRKKGSAFPLVIAFFVLLLLGAGGVGGYYYLNQSPTAPVIATIPSLITADEQVKLAGSGGALQNSLAEEAKQALPKNTVLMTYAAVENGTQNNFFTALSLPGPDILARNIDQSTVGVVHAPALDGSTDETKPFFILHTSSYERTFAGMLAWEPTMERDLAAFYPLYAAVSQTATASSTASSTPIRSTVAASTGQFVDSIVSNHDVRVLRDTEGRSILLYGYRDKQFLIIARDAASFSLLLDRLNATNKQ